MKPKKAIYYLSICFLLCALMMSFTKPKPKVFVIGDSISIHYGPYLDQALKGFFDYDRKGDQGESMKNLDIPVGANGGDSKMVLDYLRTLQMDTSFQTDYLMVNCGLHDIKRKSPESNPQVELTAYKNNLMEIIAISQEMKVKLIWVNSTPVVDTIHNTYVPFFRYNQDVLAYNQAGDSLMREAAIPVIDLYAFTIKFIPGAYMDHVHFKEEIRKQQADFIAGNLIAIDSNCKN